MAEEEKKQDTAPEAEEIKDKPQKQRKPINLGKGGLAWTIWHFVEAALLIVGGVLAIAYSNNPDIQKIIYPVVGAFLILGGFLKILTNFLPVVARSEAEAAAKAEAKKSMSYDLVVGGSFELALGITLCVMYASEQNSQEEVIKTITFFLSTFIAIMLIVAGVSLLLFAIGFIIRKLYKLYMPILEIILGLGLIALGIVVIIYMNDSKVFNQVVLIIVGIILVLAGLGMLVTTITAIKAANDAKKMSANGAAPEEGAEVKVKVTEVDYSTSEGKSSSPEEKKNDDTTAK
jgi:hypothetical protein